MKRIWTRYKEFILGNLKVIIGFGGSLILLLTVVRPSFSSLPDLYTKNQELSVKLVSLNQRLNNVNGLVASQQSVKANVALADRALPSRDDVPLLLNQVQAIATSSGVTLKSLLFAGISKPLEGNFKKISVQAVMEGDYGNIVNMLTNFENTSRIINIESITFDSRKSGEGLTVTLGLVSYFADAAADPKKKEGGFLDLTSGKINATLDYLKKLKPYDPQIIDVNIGKTNPFE